MMPSSNLSDPNFINNIVDKLKKQGLFDKFRKECLSDVDTKPAYQNLQHRVEGAVGRFLSSYEWSRDLNKKQLRDSLRRHLNESQMLVTGVDRVVEQVISPKVLTVFKPEVDQAICDYLGIDFEGRRHRKHHREELLKRKDALEEAEQNSRGMLPDTSVPPPGIPSLLDLQLPPTSSAQPPPPPPPPMHPVSSNNGLPPSSSGMPFPPMPPPNQNMSYPPGNFQNHGNYYPPGGVLHPTNIPPPPPPFNFNTSNMHSSGMDMTGFHGNMVPPQQQIQVPSGTDPQTRAILMAALNPGFLQQSAEDEREKERERRRRKKKKQVEPLTVESLLNIPLPSTKSPEKKDHKEVTMETSNYNAEVITEETVVIESNAEQEPMTEHIELDAEGQPTKVYRFAWEDNAKADNMSDVTISSVHTSDLSSFEDSGEEEEEDLEDEEEEEEEKAEESLTDGETPVKDEGIEVFEDVTVVKPKKARQLLALSYNYSDSETEETREERKARVAHEKEQRYLQRQQRRAELEAKRKEREEERARQKQEKEGEENQEIQEIEKSQVEEDLMTPEPQESPVKLESPVKTESPRKAESPRKRKTKSQLKEELREQKVLVKRMALRRQRTRNRKYLSEDFESIFNSKKQLMAEDYVLDDEQVVVEEQVVEEVTYSNPMDLMDDAEPVSPDTPTQDEPTKPTSPYSELSDISENSKSDFWDSDYEEKKSSSSPQTNQRQPPSQFYNKSDLYKPHLSRKRRPLDDPDRSVSPATREKFYSNIPHANKRSRSPSAGRSISSQSQSADRKNYSSCSRSRSRSKSRSKSRSSRSVSRSRSRSRSFSSESQQSPRRKESGSEERSPSRSNSRSLSRSRRSQSSPDDRRGKGSIAAVSFGEAARRSAQRWIETVDFGEAERRVRGEGTPVPHVQFTPPPYALRGMRGRGSSPRGSSRGRDYIPPIGYIAPPPTSPVAAPVARAYRDFDAPRARDEVRVKTDGRSFSSGSQEEDVISGRMSPLGSSPDSLGPIARSPSPPRPRRRSRSLSPGEMVDSDPEELEISSPTGESPLRRREWSPEAHVSRRGRSATGDTPPPAGGPTPYREGAAVAPSTSPIIMTRALRRKSEQDNAPIAKRLRR